MSYTKAFVCGGIYLSITALRNTLRSVSSNTEFNVKPE